jgi:hypothetical protein
MKHIFSVYICLLSSILNQIISSSMINPLDFRPEWPNNIISGLTYSQVHVYTVLLLCFISIALRYAIFHKTLFTNYLYVSIYYMLFSYQTGYIMSHYIPCLIANNRYITDLTIVFLKYRIQPY